MYLPLQIKFYMHHFYLHRRDGNHYIMDADESHHCLRVLRMKEGEVISFTDGAGMMFNGLLRIRSKNEVQVEVEKEIKGKDHQPSLHIAIAPTKNADRFEWFLEKAVEIGVGTITPLLCERSERKNIRTDRLEKITVSAMKQSMRTWLPRINEMVPFEVFIRDLQPDRNNLFIAWCGEPAEHLLRIPAPEPASLVMIGPEGDFSDNEVRLSRDKGFLPVSLGESRLRTETAGIVCAQIIADRMML